MVMKGLYIMTSTRPVVILLDEVGDRIQITDNWIFIKDEIGDVKTILNNFLGGDLYVFKQEDGELKRAVIKNFGSYDELGDGKLFVKWY